MSDLFSKPNGISGKDLLLRPLADRMRPETLSCVYGQEHLTSEDMPLHQMIKNKITPSTILWGPPGCGKTTIAQILAKNSGMHYESLSAIFAGVKDLKSVFEAARMRRLNGLQTILFVDEIHRFMKSQQDAFLPVLEDGTITLIGATTENPSFELNAPLLSRCQVLILKRLSHEAIESLLKRVETNEGHLLPLTPQARQMLIEITDGDGRYALSIAQRVLEQTNTLNPEGLMILVQKRAPLYDKNNQSHYNLISALHKSIRGSDPDAALYWYSRMLSGGEDPHFIARRIVRMATEDIGLADPQALSICTSAWEAFNKLGSPEGELALAQAIVYLATAPKSNAIYTAFKNAKYVADKTGSLSPPKHILNAPTSLMKQEGYSEGYIYDPETPESFSGQNYFPDEIGRKKFYEPVHRGFERDINKRLNYWNKLRKAKDLENHT